jgi:hypothetical protein
VVESIQGSRSDLTLPISKTRQVDELSINDLAQSHVRTTRCPWINIDDILSGVDRVSHSITECIELAEAALRRPNDSARQIPFGLRNTSARSEYPWKISTFPIWSNSVLTKSDLKWSQDQKSSIRRHY